MRGSSQWLRNEELGACKGPGTGEGMETPGILQALQRVKGQSSSFDCREMESPLRSGVKGRALVSNTNMDCAPTAAVASRSHRG